MKVLYDEELAIYIDPESCGGTREGVTEALTGAHVGQPLSDERLPNRSADAFQSAEGNTSRRDIEASHGTPLKDLDAQAPSARST